MKKMLLLTILGISTFTSFIFGEAKGISNKSKIPLDNCYATTGLITELNYETNEVIFENFNGYEYAFYGIEDWAVNDCVSVILYDNGTPEIFDDEVVDVKYSGWEIYRWETKQTEDGTIYRSIYR